MKKTLDIEELNLNFEGLPEVMLIESLESFCSETEVYINELRGAEREKAVNIVGNIKTLAKTVGARFLATLCTEFKNTKGQGKVTKEHILAHWPEVRIEVETYIASLKY